MPDHSEVVRLAKKYYPNLWNLTRINALVAAGRLTQDEADEITKGDEREA